MYAGRGARSSLWDSFPAPPRRGKLQKTFSVADRSPHSHPHTKDEGRGKGKGKIIKNSNHYSAHSDRLGYVIHDPNLDFHQRSFSTIEFWVKRVGSSWLAEVVCFVKFRWNSPERRWTFLDLGWKSNHNTIDAQMTIHHTDFMSAFFLFVLPAFVA